MTENKAMKNTISIEHKRTVCSCFSRTLNEAAFIITAKSIISNEPETRGNPVVSNIILESLIRNLNINTNRDISYTLVPYGFLSTIPLLVSGVIDIADPDDNVTNSIFDHIAALAESEVSNIMGMMFKEDFKGSFLNMIYSDRKESIVWSSGEMMFDPENIKPSMDKLFTADLDRSEKLLERMYMEADQLA